MFNIHRICSDFFENFQKCCAQKLPTKFITFWTLIFTDHVKFRPSENPCLILLSFFSKNLFINLKFINQTWNKIGPDLWWAKLLKSIRKTKKHFRTGSRQRKSQVFKSCKSNKSCLSVVFELKTFQLWPTKA